MTAEREAPMPPVFMHSSTMMHFRVFLMLFVMVSRSKGFRLIRSITCTAPALSKAPPRVDHFAVADNGSKRFQTTAMTQQMKLLKYIAATSKL